MIHMEEVGRVVFLLDLTKPLPGITWVCGADLFLIHATEEVDICAFVALTQFLFIFGDPCFMMLFFIWIVVQGGKVRHDS